MAFVQGPGLQPQATSTGMTFGGIQNNWDAIKEDFDAVAYLPFGDEYWDAMNQIMNAIGNREIAKNPVVRWFELTRMEVPITVDGAPTGGGTGTTITITIPTTEIDPVTGNSWPIVNEIWRHAPSGNLYQIISKAESTPGGGYNEFQLAPLYTTTVTSAVADGDQFFYVGVSVGENSGAQDAKFVFDTVHSSPLQTMRNDGLSSSEALYNQLWYSQLENGVQTPYSNSRDIIYLQREHQVSIVNTFLAGGPSNVLDGAGASIYNPAATGFQTTEGLLTAINDRGQVEDCAGGLTLQNLYELEAALTGQDASVKNYMVWTTVQSSAALESVLLQYNRNANISVNKVEMQKTFWGEGAYADLMASTYSFNNVVFNNKNFGLNRMGIFDNPQMLGVGLDGTANAWKEYAVFLPMTSTGVDDGLGNMGKYIRLAHKPGAFMNMWQTGGRAAANKTANWELGIHIVSEIAFKFINANKYGLLTGTGGYVPAP